MVMKKIILFSIAIFITLYTNAQKAITMDMPDSVMYVEDLKTNQQYLFGNFNGIAPLLTAPGWENFKSSFESYQPDVSIMKCINDKLDDNYSFKVFIGTWCSDSQLQLPNFYKVLSESKISLDSIQFYALDLDKKGANKEEEQFDIQRVPTIIMYKENKEVSRIIEVPSTTFEQDILDKL